MFRDFESAVDCLRQLKNNNEIPKCVENAVESNHNSHVIRGNTGTKQNNNDNDSVDEYNDYDNDTEDDNEKRQQESDQITETKIQ